VASSGRGAMAAQRSREGERRRLGLPMGECERGGEPLAHTGGMGASPVPAGQPSAEHPEQQGRAHVWPASISRRPERGHLACIAARVHLADD
jgi:hypothetical protein